MSVMESNTTKNVKRARKSRKEKNIQKGEREKSIIVMNSPNLAKNEKTLKKEKYKYFMNILYTLG
jgi:hypothetical protein